MVIFHGKLLNNQMVKTINNNPRHPLFPQPLPNGGSGSFVIHSLVDKLHPRIDAVKARVKAAQPQLSESKFSAPLRGGGKGGVPGMNMVNLKILLRIKMSYKCH